MKGKIMIKFKTYSLLPSFETNTYLVWDTESLEAILIDPAAPNTTLRDEIKSLKLNLRYIINTHGHGDHIGGNEFFHAAFETTIAIHSDDADMLIESTQNLSAFMNEPFVSPPAKKLLSDKEAISIGKANAVIYHTPGHTAGGIVIHIGNLLFTGDTIFYRSVGRTDLPGGNTNQLISSIRNQIFILPDNTNILPGHGASTTVRDEKEQNPYV
jgi:glyoxylase-like metal-dependent hydrolase (beta-lactamase superfamily II)